MRRTDTTGREPHLTRIHRDSIFQRKAEESSIRWTLDNDTEIRLAKLPRNISLRIASPRMTQLLREEREMGLTSYDEILEDD